MTKEEKEKKRNGFPSFTWQTGVDGVEGLDPRFPHSGKSYSDHATDWFNWFLSAHADKRNSGPVVFLRSKGIPDRTEQAYDLKVTQYSVNTSTATNAPGYPSLYVNEPNIRIGADRLQIFSDQVVFVPIIVSYTLSTDPYKDWGLMQQYTGLTVDNGDNPPALRQLTVNEKPIQLPEGLGDDFTNFRIATPIFTAVVPEAPYGSSIKDFLEGGSVSPGSYPAVIAGYFVILKFRAGASYRVHSFSSSGRESRGTYFSELLYQIDVADRPPRQGWNGRITFRRPASFQANANEALRRLNETFPNDVATFKSYFSTLNL